jgi:MoaA/NifB/PqqE/SkfB family radical SAM enzyme
MSVSEQFNKYKIHQMQLDPFGVCNARCWFCPVKYKGNPTSGKEVMSVELLRKIIENIIEERDKENGLVNKHFGGFYTAHYNEILLYPHFEELLKICQEYRLCFMVLSNGIPLTPDKVDLIIKYRGVVNGICLNIPGFEPDVWSKRSGINIKQFDKLISNINYAIEKLPHMVQNKSFSIQVNGSNENSFSERGGWLDKGPEFPSDMDLNPNSGELSNQINKAKELFPSMQIFSVPSLIDRAGLLDDVMTNKGAIERNLMKNDKTKKVIGCGNGREVGGRPVGWIHVNSAGKAFLCCNDYDMEIIIGDFKTQELKDFWGNENHIQQVEKSYETICRNCASAIFN